MKRTRWAASAVVLALAVTGLPVAAYGSGSGAQMRPRAAGATCTPSLAGDSCSTSDLTQTSVTETYTFTLVHPNCDSNPEPCTFTVSTSGGADGQPPQPTSSWTCPWRSWSNTSDGSTALTQNTYTCTVHWDWSGTHRPTTGLNANVWENSAFHGMWMDGLHGFHVDIPAAAQPPDASFTTTAVDADHGSYRFTATSTDPGGLSMTHAWTSSDGGSGSGTTFDHTFTADGTYTVKLTSTNSAGAGSSVTHPVQVTLAKATISVSVNPTLPPGGLVVGQTIAVPVTVTAGPSDLTGDSTSLTLGGDVASITATPPGLSGFALAKGQSATFTYQVTTSKTGPLTFTAVADGTGPSPGNAAVHDTDQLVVPVSSNALRITMVSDPRKVALAVTDKGAVTPKTIKITVKLANTTKKKLSHVTLESLRPVPKDRTQVLDQLGFKKGLLPIAFGTIAGGASKSKTLDLKVTGDGAYVLKALALYDDTSQSGGRGIQTGEGGGFRVVHPILFFKATQDAEQVKGGHPWYVTGHIKNLSTWQNACISPLLPQHAGNAGGLGARQVGIAPLDQVAPPLAGLIAPGQTVLFVLRVDTGSDGGTRSRVALTPKATKAQVDDPCRVVDEGARKKLSNDQIKLAKDSTSFDTHVDNRPGPPKGSGAWEFFGAYGEGSYKTLASLYQGGLAFVDEYGSVPKLYAAMQRIDLKSAAQRAGAALSSMAQATRIAASFWINATPEERAAFLDKTVDDIVTTSGKVWDGTQALIRKGAEGWFETVVRSYYAGDTETMFHSLGSTTSSVLNTVAIETVKCELGLAVLKRGLALTKVADRVLRSGKLVAALREMPVGKILNIEEMQRLWGLSKADYQAFTKIIKEEGIVMGVRGRAPISVKNIEEGAVWKHENLKPKNVNDIDMRFLGFAKEDSGLVAFRTYTNKEKSRIIRAIERAGLDAEQRKAALSRATTRFGEEHYLGKIEGFAAKGEIDVGFNYADNGLEEASTSTVRKFGLDAEKVQGGTYYRPLQENVAIKPGGVLPKWCKEVALAVLCRVSGDMDGVYMTTVNGTSLSDVARVRIYNKLAAVGWQHPETLTWINNDGQFFFGAKKKILAGLEVGGEPMIEFGPDGVARATYFDLKKSFLFNKDSYYIDVVGGYAALQ